MTFELNWENESEYKTWESEHPSFMESPPIPFTFAFKISKIENEDKFAGDFIQLCVDFIEKQEIYDDYDDFEMSIKYEPDLADTIHIIITIIDKI